MNIKAYSEIEKLVQKAKFDYSIFIPNLKTILEITEDFKKHNTQINKKLILQYYKRTRLMNENQKLQYIYDHFKLRHNPFPELKRANITVDPHSYPSSFSQDFKIFIEILDQELRKIEDIKELLPSFDQIDVKFLEYGMFWSLNCETNGTLKFDDFIKISEDHPRFRFLIEELDNYSTNNPLLIQMHNYWQKMFYQPELRLGLRMTNYEKTYIYVQVIETLFKPFASLVFPTNERNIKIDRYIAIND